MDPLKRSIVKIWGHKIAHGTPLSPRTIDSDLTDVTLSDSLFLRASTGKVDRWQKHEMFMSVAVYFTLHTEHYDVWDNALKIESLLFIYAPIEYFTVFGRKT